MKRFIIILLLIATFAVHAQQPPLTQRHEQQLESMADKDEQLLEDESLLQQLEMFRTNPLNLNTATEDELQLLQLLNALQIKALLQYRMLLGRFIHVYELQAVPYWDVQAIRRILPYITIRDDEVSASFVSTAIKNGSSSLLFRLSGSSKKPAGFTDTGTGRFWGAPGKILVRYRYNYKNFVQWGALGEKDPGEQLFSGSRKTGFDFYSFHAFARKLGIVQSLAVGDYTLNMGQGLVQWQGMAFGKGELTGIKRQSAIVRPYNSAGEYNFHRGLAITIGHKKLAATAFYSSRKSSANLSLDSVGAPPVITSFLTSGLHRTASELAERNNIIQRAMGGAISYEDGGWHIGGNFIQHSFSYPVRKRQEPHNLFSLKGRRLFHWSLDYDFTFRNLHLFGEAASNHALNKALINGLLLSLDKKADISILIRYLEPGYQPLNASSFTENAAPSNETGIFTALALRPIPRLRVDAYADVHRFPWLKSLADAPTWGKEYQVQLIYQPRKSVELSTRFRANLLQTNDQDHENAFHSLINVLKTNWRIQVAWQPGTGWQAAQRIEVVWYKGPVREQGYLLFTDLRYAPPHKPFTIGGRLQVFETDGFNSRIYAVEQDAPYAAPAAYHKGIRYYINLQYEAPRRKLRTRSIYFPEIKIWLRFAGILAEMQAGTASRPHGVDYKLQVIFCSF
ncbi:MAG TPA: helix-hairpin-helix domain-containing protein [Chitinophagaceae bacterium]|nr:helix-hairpin-helix domain-containing protein [Chitinophagaceae bacterium]